MVDQLTAGRCTGRRRLRGTGSGIFPLPAAGSPGRRGGYIAGRTPRTAHGSRVPVCTHRLGVGTQTAWLCPPVALQRQRCLVRAACRVSGVARSTAQSTPGRRQRPGWSAAEIRRSGAGSGNRPAAHQSGRPDATGAALQAAGPSGATVTRSGGSRLMRHLHASQQDVVLNTVANRGLVQRRNDIEVGGCSLLRHQHVHLRRDHLGPKAKGVDGPRIWPQLFNLRARTKIQRRLGHTEAHIGFLPTDVRS